MNPRLTMRRHARKIAVVGALVAVSATTTMALVAGTAAAAPSSTQPGKCVDNVNVRSEPSATSKIVAVCDSGKAVQVAETKDGFVHLTDLKGWAAQEFVSVNGKTPPAPASRAAGTGTTDRGSDSTARPTHESGDDTDANGSGAAAGDDAAADDSSPDNTSADNTAGDDTSAPDASDAPDSGADATQGDGSDQGQGADDQGDQGADAASPSPLGGLLG